jgi:hypothetical protein
MPNLPLPSKTFSTVLSAPGAHTGSEKNVLCENKVLFVYTVASIDTNVTVGLRVSMNGSAWATAPGVTDVTHTTNGTFALQFTGCAPYVALELEAETGGTDVTVTVLGAYVD